MAKQMRSPYLAAILAWVIPGAGHLYQGRRQRGMIIFVSILILFLLGVLLGGIEIVDLKNVKAGAGEVILIFAQIFCGLPTLIGFLIQNPNVSMGVGRGADLGLVYAGVAGLLNLMCIIDVLMPVSQGDSHQNKIPAKG
ncbi:MAG: hypothetical protein JW860_05055 [Sedimentisphaerales bacterium]|nr:hypothetical protein [Sedimentisphaerales bacterium]